MEWEEDIKIPPEKEGDQTITVYRDTVIQIADLLRSYTRLEIAYMFINEHPWITLRMMTRAINEVENQVFLKEFTNGKARL